MQLQRIYSSWEAVKEATGTPSSRKRKVWREVLARRPAIAYWGDSWFSTPLYKNLYWHSFSRIDGISLRLGGPGRTAAKMITEAECRDYAERFLSREFDLVCLSIGGNDFLDARLEKMFRKSQRMSPQEAFEHVVNLGTFERLREIYFTAMTELSAVGGNFKVVGHGYAPIQRIGERGKTDIKNLGLAAPLIGNVGPWLWPTMQRVLASPAEARTFAHSLLTDGFRDRVLAPTAKKFRPLFSFVDFNRVPEAQEESFWYDEIHPTEAGFAVLANPYNAAIREALPATKRAAVG
ncbi:hypothetical protein [Pseudoxanthomonas indica]|uniref:GDSL-like Lipase/Acylhydrolase family protein n=1 Tax=Pseudoxanthomonas indica TaxID=428993 RepID=A0A1T5KP32_9GAMM|nr:hypothetical protein [Pseudoxanthomonas indica]GGD50630.1 hypothetical protein GCM10007235_23390 [Pseudoxanthomonas indica]SKC65514.1 hypothetical protein SAMN06296058_1885 [Pseudoxanthomonas indica]